MTFGVFESYDSRGLEAAENEKVAAKRLATLERKAFEQFGEFLSSSPESITSRLDLIGEDLLKLAGNDATMSTVLRESLIQRVADDWKKDPAFQAFLLQTYGTTQDLNDSQILEALEKYTGIGQNSVVEEETAPELQNVTANRPIDEEEGYYREPEVIDYTREARKPRRVSSKKRLRRISSRQVMSGWKFSQSMNGYLSSKPTDFTCHCGKKLAAPGYHTCNCGRQWNIYRISNKNQEQFIAREVPVRDGVVLAEKKAGA